jgi:hypothetical protein
VVLHLTEERMRGSTLYGAQSAARSRRCEEVGAHLARDVCSSDQSSASAAACRLPRDDPLLAHGETAWIDPACTCVIMYRKRLQN